MATAIVKGRAYGDFIALNEFGNLREQVPQSTVKQSKTKSRLLNRKLDSRDTSDSSLCSLRRCDLFFEEEKEEYDQSDRQEPGEPISDGRLREGVYRTDDAAAGQERSKNGSQNVAKTSHIFHIFNIPRFSCIITECRKAVPVSQGMSDAFSTGSQPQ